MSHGYKFYIQEVTKANGTYHVLDGTLKDLEIDFDGLKYSKLDGLNAVGKAKNIVVETHANATYDRVYVPDKVVHSSTTLTLTLYFFGENRQEVFKEFKDYITKGVHRYWDTARNIWFDFTIQDELKPSDENWYRGEPYFKVDVKMKNIYGECYLRKGVNLLTNGNQRFNTKDFTLAILELGNTKPANGEKVRLTFEGYLGDGRTNFTAYNSGGSVYMATINYNNNYNPTTKLWTSEFYWVKGADKDVRIFQYPDDESLVASSVENVRLEII